MYHINVIITNLLYQAVPLEKLIVSQLAKRFPAFYTTWHFLCAQQLATCHSSETDGSSPFLCKIHFNIVNLSTAKSSSGVLFPSGFSTKTLYVFLFFSMLATCPAQSILHDLIIRPLIMLLSPVCCLFPTSQTCMFLSTTVSNVFL